MQGGSRRSFLVIMSLWWPVCAISTDNIAWKSILRFLEQIELKTGWPKNRFQLLGISNGLRCLQAIKLHFYNTFPSPTISSFRIWGIHIDQTHQTTVVTIIRFYVRNVSLIWFLLSQKDHNWIWDSEKNSGDKKLIDWPKTSIRSKKDLRSSEKSFPQIINMDQPDLRSDLVRRSAEIDVNLRARRRLIPRVILR